MRKVRLYLIICVLLTSCNIQFGMPAFPVDVGGDSLLDVVSGDVQVDICSDCQDIIEPECQEDNPCLNVFWDNENQKCVTEIIENCFVCEDEQDCAQFELDCVCEEDILVCYEIAGCIDGTCKIKPIIDNCSSGCDSENMECFECQVNEDCSIVFDVCKQSVCTDNICEVENKTDMTSCGSENSMLVCLSGDCVNMNCDDQNGCTVDIWDLKLSLVNMKLILTVKLVNRIVIVSLLNHVSVWKMTGFVQLLGLVVLTLNVSRFLFMIHVSLVVRVLVVMSVK